MVKYRMLKVLTGALTIGSLSIIIEITLRENRWYEMIYDIALAVFGSALLAWLAAKIEQYHDKKSYVALS